LIECAAASLDTTELVRAAHRWLVRKLAAKISKVAVDALRQRGLVRQGQQSLVKQRILCVLGFADRRHWSGVAKYPARSFQILQVIANLDSNLGREVHLRGFLTTCETAMTGRTRFFNFVLVLLPNLPRGAA
jgi:hypothetical protein